MISRVDETDEVLTAAGEERVAAAESRATAAHQRTLEAREHAVRDALAGNETELHDEGAECHAEAAPSRRRTPRTLTRPIGRRRTTLAQHSIDDAFVKQKGRWRALARHISALDS